MQSLKRQAFHHSLPVLFGYLPFGAAFGIMLVKAGYAWYHALLMSLFVFAGSAQFIVVGLLSLGTSLVEIAFITALINIRHLFYGLSFLKEYSGFSFQKLYLMFTLTDETYAILTTKKQEPHLNNLKYFSYVSLFNHSYWVLGTLIGAIIGEAIEFNSEGIEFVFLALLIVLFMENKNHKEKRKDYAIVSVMVLASLLVFGPDYMFLASLVMLVLYLLIHYKMRQKAHA